MRQAVEPEAQGLSRWIHDVVQGSPVSGRSTDHRLMAVANDEPYAPVPSSEAPAADTTLSDQLDALGALLPVLEFALGAGFFDQFAGDFLSLREGYEVPLADLDEGFAEYLDLTRPDRELPAAEQEEWPRFLVELAAFERGLRKLSEGALLNDPPRTSAAILKGVPWAKLGRCRIRLMPGASLERFRFPVHRYWRAVCSDENPEYPDPRQVRLATWRCRGALSFLELHPNAWQVLLRLSQGETLEEARHAVGVGVASLRRMLARWIERGLVVEVDATSAHTLANG